MLRQAREREQTEAFKEEYKRRAGVEGTIAQAGLAGAFEQTPTVT